MSPKNKKKLNILRKKLDKLDNKLLGIIKIRTEIIKNVISLKNNKKEIVDKRRIAFILRKIKKASIKKKIDPTVTNKIWKNMIWSYIDFERRLFRKK
jgi:chorismate mutase